MNVPDNIQSCLLHPPHGFGKQIAGCRLCDVLGQLARVGLLPHPLVVGAQALKGQRHTPETVRLELGLDVGKTAAGRQHNPKCVCCKPESDSADRSLRVILNSFNRRFLHGVPEFDDLRIGIAP